MTVQDTEKILKKIKMAMLARGINQSQLAKDMGLTHAAVSAWFNGKSSPSLDTLLEVFARLKEPPNYFFADESTTQTINGNNNTQTSGQDVELIKTKLEVLSKTIENLDLRLKLLERNK